MQNKVYSITEELQKSKQALKQIYTVLHAAQQGKTFDATEHNKVEINPISPSIENALPIIEKTPNAEKEFDYKMAAHNLISPLTTQFTLLDILKEECLEVKEKLNNALQHIDFLTRSNNETIKISKAALHNNQSSVNEPILFEPLINGIAQLLGIKELYTDMNFVVDIKTQKQFYNNTTIVQSIIFNLIQNAIKYKKPNHENTITVNVKDTSEGVEIKVQDTGIGITEKKLQTLFKQVLSGNTSVKDSHGFGLYGVAQYVQKLNGTITAISTVNIGSTFTINLPTL